MIILLYINKKRGKKYEKIKIIYYIISISTS